MYLGGTGCGKTYRAISQSQNFVIAVPTRQLAYELALDYKEKISDIHTGEIHLGDGSMNMVCVYENLNDEVINKYDTLIVDEAHFLGDEQRGALLLQNIVNAKRKGKEVILLTATDTIPKELKEALSISVYQKTLSSLGRNITIMTIITEGTFMISWQLSQNLKRMWSQNLKLSLHKRS